MLYKLGSTDGKFDTLEPVAFKNFSSFRNREKDLEDLIAKNILDVLFEDASLMPIFQERQYQAEADIYALDEKGKLVIFELKRETAGEDAVHQALRYAQEAGQWSYKTLQNKYRQYTREDTDLRKAHKENFELEHKLDGKEINNKQRLIIIGSAADDSLINAVDYWKNQGISIDFLPYRIYELNGEQYFEFFALPYDKHRNPSDTKGVLFDTNRRYDEDSIWYMIENSRVAAWGDTKRFIEYIYPGDIVFFSHRGEGLVAAGRLKGNIVSLDDENAKYRDVEFITPVPKKKKGQKIPAMPFQNVREITGKSFFWAATLKKPYLSKDEAENLANELRTYLEM
ncbi:MAG: endonuclease NucS [Gemmatimonadota bacterium]|nr:endonuclease NucS [Gemmatimonadota bacterium]MDE2954206.1 endonuclease NucS [Gemmatimonadota bacterium]